MGPTDTNIHKDVIGELTSEPSRGTSHSLSAANTRWLSYLVLLMAGFMDLLDTTVVNVAFPSIQRDLGASLAAVQWVVAAYALAFGLLLVTGGRLGDLYGRRRMFLLGVAGFTLASALAGAAPSPGLLIIGRAFQGAAAAIMVPQILATVQVIFSATERQAAYGLYGGVTGLAAVAGPLVSGYLVARDPFGLAWRSIFLVNVPLGLAALVLAARLVPESRAPNARRLDLVGVALLSAALLGVLYPLVQGRELGWPWWTAVLALVSLPMFVWFLRHEHRLTLTDASPLVPLGLFRERAFSAGLLTSLVFFAGTGAFFLIVTATLQFGLHYPPLRAGLAWLPFSIAAAVGSGLSVPASRRLGRRILQAGAAVFMLGLLLLEVAFHRTAGSIGPTGLLIPLATCGLGMGLVVAPLVDVILGGVHEHDAGAASGVLGAVGQLGQAIGISAIGTAYFALLGAPSPGSYTRALELTLVGEAAVFAACIGLMFLLPEHPKEEK
jgi:EmrB/QacA subfamily drug resistance transporter